MLKRVASFIGLFVAIGCMTTVFGAEPTITTKDKGKTFTVKFDKPASQVCVVFRMTKPTEPIGDPNFPDGYYAPMKCLNVQFNPEIDEYTTDWIPIPTYNVDWDVYGQIRYFQGDKTTVLKSNSIRVHY